ncbi:LacI family DNA-binding transcriptional regulator [Paenibacillus sp. MB22_1]|uniref:LacI family DNA-binding transcriptional regulator n=1 Tax=Paenibacillus TaxID=44249 RepID=UPI0001AFD069|nr:MULTISPECIES: LacI family DNA-binding transcriptional regulator [unclassified Paenibacillus]EES73902.1 transcriptional regulator, LacI family [Paenibacillus sp. oral taxon 786 str. D14]MCT2194497.1 LacI family transcriptional regulator [Paenibacillus sp. p3-SID1389]
MITIKDIARVAGVSHTTVSRALNGSPLIKPETRAKIEKIAAEMNYVPNVSAKSLVMKKTYTIGLFFSSIDQGTSASFLVDAIKGIHHALDENYSLTVHGIDGIRHLEGISPHRFDGILVMSQSDADNAFIYHVKQAGIPLVVLNRYLDDPGIVNVVANDREGVREAINYAIAQGHRRLAIMEGKAGFRSAAERKQGFLESLLAHGLALPAEYQVAGDYSIDSGYRMMNALLDLKEPPTLVFCANDDMAIGAMNACFARGVNVPNQVSLIGFDDIVFAGYTNPALTTIRKPVADISELGTRKLIELMQPPSTESSDKEQPTEPPGETLFVPTTLVIRQSVAKIS